MKYFRRSLVRRRPRRRMRGRGVPAWLIQAGKFIGKNLLLPGLGRFIL